MVEEGSSRKSKLETAEVFAEVDFDNMIHTTEQRRIYKRKPKTAVNLVNQIIARRGIAAEKSDNQLQGVWQSIVPAEIANQTRVAAVKRGILEITVSHSGLIQLLNFSKEEYLNQLKQQLGNRKLKDIRFRLGRI